MDDQTISSLGPLLRTSCATGICFADLIPQIAEQYPDSKVRLIFTPTRSPIVLFQAKQGGSRTSLLCFFVFHLCSKILPFHTLHFHQFLKRKKKKLKFNVNLLNPNKIHISGALMVNINGLVFMYIIESSETSHQAAAFALDIVANIHLHVEVRFLEKDNR